MNPPIAIVLLLLVALAAPISANSEEVRSSEARAALGALKDLLRRKYHENGDRADVRWTIADIMAHHDSRELNGSYFTYKSYTLRWPIGRENVAILSCRDVWSGQQEVTDLELEVNLASGAARFNDPPKPFMARIMESSHFGWLEVVAVVCLSVVAIGLWRLFVTRRKERQK